MTKEAFLQASGLVELMKELKSIAKMVNGQEGKVSFTLNVTNGESSQQTPMSVELSTKVLEKMVLIKEDLEKEFESL